MTYEFNEKTGEIEVKKNALENYLDNEEVMNGAIKAALNAVSPQNYPVDYVDNTDSRQAILRAIKIFYIETADELGIEYFYTEKMLDAFAADNFSTVLEAVRKKMG